MVIQYAVIYVLDQLLSPFPSKYFRDKTLSESHSAI